MAKMGLGLLLALLFFGTIGALIFLQFMLAATPEAGTAAELAVTVLKRAGDVRFSGVLLVDPPTPLAALEAAGKAGGFEVHVRAYPNGRYVDSIANETAEGVGGWVYRVATGNTTATYPNVASDRTMLSAGDRVTWHWTEEPVTET